MLEEEGQQVVAEGKLYDINTIALGAFWGGPLAPGYMLYANYKKLGEEEGAKNILIWTILITYLMFGGLFMLPEQTLEKMPTTLIPFLTTIAVYFIAKHFQGEVLDCHRVQGGLLFSRWRALWVGLVCAVLTLLLILPLILILP